MKNKLAPQSPARIVHLLRPVRLARRQSCKLAAASSALARMSSPPPKALLAPARTGRACALRRRASVAPPTGSAARLGQISAQEQTEKEAAAGSDSDAGQRSKCIASAATTTCLLAGHSKRARTLMLPRRAQNKPNQSGGDKTTTQRTTYLPMAGQLRADRKSVVRARQSLTLCLRVSERASPFPFP